MRSIARVTSLLHNIIKSTEEWMIQCRLRELIGAKARQERRRITYDDIQAQTGVNKNTLTRLANDRAGMVGLSVVDRLCAYFDCQPGDLFIYVDQP
jgi:putative transcriptional regulator